MHEATRGRYTPLNLRGSITRTISLGASLYHHHPRLLPYFLPSISQDKLSDPGQTMASSSGYCDDRMVGGVDARLWPSSTEELEIPGDVRIDALFYAE